MLFTYGSPLLIFARQIAGMTSSLDSTLTACTTAMNQGIIRDMSLVLLHDLEGEEVLVNLDRINAATRKYPDDNAVMKEPYTKLFYAQKDKGMEALGFPDSVKESPAEICDLIQKK